MIAVLVAAALQDGYRIPRNSILTAALTPWYQNVSIASVSPDGANFLSLEKDGMVSISVLAKPFLNLGGLQIDPKAVRERSLTTQSLKNFRITNVTSGRTISLNLPQGVRVSNPKWSPDGTHLAFFAHFESSTLLYSADATSGNCRPVTNRPLLPTLSTDLVWDGAGKRIAAVFRPANFGPPPPPPLAVAQGPQIQASEEKPRNLFTFSSTLQTANDKALFSYYGTGQLGLVDAVSGKITEFGKPALYESVSLSDDGKYVRTAIVDQAPSVGVPVDSFATRDVLIDSAGKETVLERHPADYSGETVKPKEDAGRDYQWFPGGVVYLKTVAKGSVKEDRVVFWPAPFLPDRENVLYAQKNRIDNLKITADGKSLFLTEAADGGPRIEFVSLAGGIKAVTLAAPGSKSTLLTDEADHVSLATDGSHVFLGGTTLGKDPRLEAPRPYVDLVSLETGESKRIFESKSEEFEQPLLRNGSSTQFLVTRQSPTKAAQVFAVDTSAKTERQLTNNEGFAPDISQAHRETITVTRVDGFKFQVNVTLPKVTYRNPALIWIYPTEYENQGDYDNSKKSYNRNLFHTFAVHNKWILIREGYVVVEPDIPIVGPAGRMNDEFIPQLRNSLSAVIDELARRNWIDRDRLGAFGHSYGAFGVVSAMIHTPFFKCGIAGDGCYMRSLTPFGFQSEDRPLWSARGTYQEMSPFLYAEQITGALLLYHGMEDQNAGTSPINSQRLFGALQSLGKPSTLLMYPYEDHLQISRETILDQWARFSEWLDRYLKSPAK